MHSEAGEPEEHKPAPHRRMDRVSLLLALATLVIVGWTAWLRFAPASRPVLRPSARSCRRCRLIDLETAEPLILLGLKGKVVWVVFWSAGTPSGDASLSRLESVWKRSSRTGGSAWLRRPINVKRSRAGAGGPGGESTRPCRPTWPVRRHAGDLAPDRRIRRSIS